MSAMKSTRRRRVLLAIAMAGGVSAASLGGLRADDVGAENAVIASCDANGVDAEYRTNFHPPSRQFRVNQVVVRNVSEACDGLTYELTLFDGDGGSYRVTGTLELRNIKERPGQGRAGTARISVRYSAESVDGVSLLIGGATATP